MFEFYWDSPVLDDDRDDQELDEAEEDEAGAQEGEDVDGLEFKFEFRYKKIKKQIDSLSDMRPEGVTAR